MAKKYSEIGKRLRILRGNKTQADFAVEIGTTLRAYQYYESGERVPSIGLLTLIATKYKKSLDWLLTGTALGELIKNRREEQNISVEDLAGRLGVPPEMLLRWEAGEDYPSGVSLDLIQRELGTLPEAIRDFSANAAMERMTPYEEADVAPNDEFIFVPEFSGKISAGMGISPASATEIRIAFRKDWIRRKGDPAKMSLIKVSGDSMEPTLLSGDLVLIDHGRNYLDYQGGIYAISIESQIMIKRLQGDPESKRVQIISDNPKYKPIEADLDKLQINGRVIWFGRELER